jgi:DNA (cytosine-5)-methyltransferase 1
VNAVTPNGVVLFAGGGGSTQGLADAGVNVVLAINHNPTAIASHAANHKGQALAEDVFVAQPYRVWFKRSLSVLWASPSCTHFSRARGGEPVNEQERAHADVVLDWAAQAKPRLIFVENVPEFLTWGPLDADSKPDPERKGELFEEWRARLALYGYRIEWRTLRACDYGVPTIRNRLYLVARRDGVKPRWPKPTHGPGLLPYRSAAECLDFTDLGRSIFGRSKPLAPKTQARIAQGLVKFVLRNPRPYLVPSPPTATQGHEALVLPWLAKHYTGAIGSDAQLPLGTVTARDHHSLCAAWFKPFSPDQPAQGEALCAAFITSYYSGGGIAGSLFDPLPAVVTKARHALMTARFSGRPYALTDITMRMLKPYELKLASGFPSDYEFMGNVADQIAQIGNAVCPKLAEVIVRANL